MHYHHVAMFHRKKNHSLTIAIKCSCGVAICSFQCEEHIFPATHWHCSTLFLKSGLWKSIHKAESQHNLLELCTYYLWQVVKVNVTCSASNIPYFWFHSSRFHSVLCTRRIEPALWVLTEDNISSFTVTVNWVMWSLAMLSFWLCVFSCYQC